jgi:hypothetical protein
MLGFRFVRWLRDLADCKTLRRPKSGRAVDDPSFIANQATGFILVTGAA